MFDYSKYVGRIPLLTQNVFEDLILGEKDLNKIRNLRKRMKAHSNIMEYIEVGMAVNLYKDLKNIGVIE